jgi:hypothetical protein
MLTPHEPPAPWTPEGYMPAHDAVLCKCGWHGDREDLVRGYEVERCHPKNKGKWDGSPDLYKTFFEECPTCGRIYWADGQRVRESYSPRS